MTDPRLFGRVWQLTVGVPGRAGLRWEGRVVDGQPSVEGLSMDFSVTKSRKRSSNKAEISLWNVAPDSLGVLQSPGCEVRLVAGYAEASGLVFEGQIAKRGVTIEWARPQLKVKIEAGDGESALSRVSAGISLDAGASFRDAVRACCLDMGIATGNLDDVAGIDRQFAGGFVAVGPTRDILTRLLRDVGCEYSIQNGALQALAPRAARRETAVLLNETSGLVGTPSKTKDGIEAKSLLQPRILPGSLVQVESIEVEGIYVVSEVTHSGSTRGGEWYSGMTAKERKA